MLAEFPIKSKIFKAKAKKAGLIKQEVLTDITNKIVKSLDEEFKANYNTTFTSVFKKQGKENEVKKIRYAVRESKRNIEEQWKETCVER